MKVEEISLPLTNKLATDYLDQNENVSRFFDYSNWTTDTFRRRAEELKYRTYPREALANYLKSFHQKFNVNKQTLNNIERFKDPNSCVIIGGQQAGVLTGPLYTIHKVVSILKLSEELEESLNVPVLPIFWVAGEDHDFAEINHIFMKNGTNIKKSTINQSLSKKLSASDIEIDHEKLHKWIEEIIQSYGETVHTAGLLDRIKGCLNNSNTYVDFFIHLIYQLFPHSGLIVIDSGDQELRKLEAPFFEQLIDKNEQLSKMIINGQKSIKEAHYGEPIAMNKDNAHLFYTVDGDRVLLERHGERFEGKNNECSFTKQELLQIVQTNPERLSNNVVTRPLMQEYLFPTLGFIAGPGELAYWSTLQKAFHLFGYKVPPLVPRLMITFIDHTIEKYLNDTKMSMANVLAGETSFYKEQWLNNQTKWDIDEEFKKASTEINASHLKLRALSQAIDKQLGEIAEKNGNIIQSQLDFLQARIEKTIRSSYDIELKKYDMIDLAVKPNGLPQERVWNILSYINEYGTTFVEELLGQSLTINNKHKLIYL